VIYWAWSNVLSLLQQYTIMKRNGAEIHLWKNLGVEKLLVRGSTGEGGGAGALVARSGASMRRSAEKLAQQVDGWKKMAVEKLQGPRGASASGASAPAASAAASGDGQADGGASAAMTEKAEMTREQALRTLGLEPGATASQIEAAYRARARQNGSLNGSEKLSRARDVLRGTEGS